ncbi:DUF2782 domain-containing protein [Crenobacter caeni]|uniref:DUF2782 domain-containing protein n=1 Tax=Crenobacter caeni TaxID=2705474 RepID=A0A6B2KTP8_9NEIS|nr:DUF2782 domain-containing protein [Crenobacter caeni]NDV13484.1 DUF2782 domain-containing protein [Crenobacter caeni]
MRRTLFALLVASPLALADTPPAPAPLPPPPAIADGVVQPGAPEPEVRIIQKGSDKIEEYRINGLLYMIKVTPSIGVPYYLVDEDGSGNLKQIDPTRRVVIPQWVLMRF